MAFADLCEGGEPQSHGAGFVLISVCDFMHGTLLYHVCLQDGSYFTEKMGEGVDERLKLKNSKLIKSRLHGIIE